MKLPGITVRNTVIVLSVTSLIVVGIFFLCYWNLS